MIVGGREEAGMTQSSQYPPLTHLFDRIAVKNKYWRERRRRLCMGRERRRMLWGRRV